MIRVEAIYQNGVFKPLVPVVLPENQQVKLEVTPVENNMLAWFNEVRRIQQAILERHGCLPDSTPEIAEDRLR